MGAPDNGPAQGKQLYQAKPGGKKWTKINWTGSPGASDGLRANIEYDDCHMTNVEVTFILKVTNNPASSTDKDHYSLKMGSHGSDSESSELYENPTPYGGGKPSLRVEAPHHGSYHGCSGAQTFDVPAMPINNTKVITLKFVRWNVGSTSVHTEWYYDFTSGNGSGPFQKSAVFEDSGSGKCGIAPIGLDGCINGSPNGALQQTVRLNGGKFDLVPQAGGTGGSMIEIIPGQSNGDNPPPAPGPQPDSTLKYFLSGGKTGVSNTNVNDSLGGVITTTEIVPDSMDNIFDDVGHNLSSPETNFRCVYIKNVSGTQTFKDARAYLSEQDNYLGIRAGLQGAANTPEQVIDDETTPPDGGFVQIYHVPTENTDVDPVCFNAYHLGENPQMWFSATMQMEWLVARQNQQSIDRVAFWMARVGTPTGNAHVYLKDSGDNIIGEFGTPGGFPVSSLSVRDPNHTQTSNTDQYGLVVLDAGSAISDHKLQQGDQITLDYDQGDGTNHIRILLFTNFDEDIDSAVDKNGNRVNPWPAAWQGNNIAEDGWTIHLKSNKIDPKTQTDPKDPTTGQKYHFDNGQANYLGDMFIKGPACFSTTVFRPKDYATGVILPDIPPGGYVAIWLVREIPKEAPDTADVKSSLVIEGAFV